MGTLSSPKTVTREGQRWSAGDIALDGEDKVVRGDAMRWRYLIVALLTLPLAGPVCVDTSDAIVSFMAEGIEAGDPIVVQPGERVALAAMPVGYDVPEAAWPIPVHCEWRQLTGEPVEIEDRFAWTLVFDAPDCQGSVSRLIFEVLLQSDLQEYRDTVVVTVASAPVATVDRSVTACPGDRVTLDGSGSHDPCGGSLGFAWRQVSGPSVVLDSTTRSHVSFDAPSTEEVVVLTLTVTNGIFSDTAAVEVAVGNAVLTAEPEPEIEAIASSVVGAAPFEVVLTASRADGLPLDRTSCEWQIRKEADDGFVDVATLDGVEVAHVFSKGTYLVTLCTVFGTGVMSCTETLNVSSTGQTARNIQVVDSAVDGAPVAMDSQTATMTNAAILVALNAADPEGQRLDYSVVDGPMHGVLGDDDGDKLIRYTPATDYTGTDSFTFKAGNGSHDSNVATVTVTVKPQNDPPIAIGSTLTVAEDSGLSILLSAMDPDKDPLTYTIVEPPAHGTLADDDGDSRVLYRPNANFNGTDVFTFRVTDGLTNSNVAAVAITVARVNDAPVFVGPADCRLAPNETRTLCMMQVHPGPADETDQKVRFTASSSNSLVVANQDLVIDGDLLTISAGMARGKTTIAVTAHDDGGAANGGKDTSVPWTFDVQVDAVVISGRLTRSGTDEPLAHTEVLCASSAGGTLTPASGTTDDQGRYTITVPAGWSGRVAPSAAKYVFSPASRTYYEAVQDQASQDYAGQTTLTSTALYVDDNGATQPGFDPTQPIGSIRRPFTTIQAAADIAGPGDTVYIKSGVYTPAGSAESVVLVPRSGTSASPITFRNYGADRVVLDANGRFFGIRVVGQDYITIQGLEITNALRAGIILSASNHYLVQDNVIHDVIDTTSVNLVIAAISARDAHSDGVIRNNEVYDSSIGILLRNQDGAYIENCVVERNYIHDIAWYDALGVYNNKNADGIACNTTRNTIIRNNVITRCGDDGMDIYLSLNCLIERNVCFNIGDGVSGMPLDAMGDGNGIKSSTGGGGGHVFQNNIAFNNELRGFDQDHVQATAPGNTYLNNVAFANGTWGWLIEGLSSTDTVLRNNIGYLNSTKEVRIKGVTPADSAYNFWADGIWPNDDTQIEWPVPTGNSLSGNPMFVAAPPAHVTVDPATYVVIDLDDPNFGYVAGFELQAGSPCIDAGLDVDLPFSGDAPDLGAYERP